jgi:hypothetical protein
MEPEMSRPRFRSGARTRTTPAATSVATGPRLTVPTDAPLSRPAVLRLSETCGPDTWCLSVYVLPPLRDGSERPRHLVFSLWEPGSSPWPFRMPTLMGVAQDGPLDDLVEFVGDAPVHELPPHAEVWSAWLRMVRASTPLDEGLRDCLERAIAEIEAHEDAQWAAAGEARRVPRH